MIWVMPIHIGRRIILNKEMNMENRTLLLFVTALALGTGAARADGKALYDQHCKKCHAADGSGKKDGGEWMPVVKTLKLDKPEKLNILSADAKKMTDEEMTKLILDGKDKMKSLKEKVSADDAKALVAYTRELQSKAK
jgi:mono/diheme cytochrome c family protein